MVDNKGSEVINIIALYREVGVLEGRLAALESHLATHAKETREDLADIKKAIRSLNGYAASGKAGLTILLGAGTVLGFLVTQWQDIKHALFN